MGEYHIADYSKQPSRVGPVKGKGTPPMEKGTTGGHNAPRHTYTSKGYKKPAKMSY